MTEADDAIALGTDIQRRIGVKTSRDEPLARFTTMRVGGPADLFAEVAQPVRAARHSSGSPGAGTCPTSSSGGARPRHQRRRDPRPGHAGPRPGHAHRRRPLIADAGLPMAKAATRPSRRACPGSSSGSRSRAPSEVPCGPTPARTTPTSPASSRRLSSCAADGTEGVARREASGSATATAGSSTCAARRAAGVVTWTRPSADARRPGAIARAARRDPHAGARHTSRSACRRPAASSATRRRLRRPPHRGAGLKGHRVGGAAVSEKHANFIVNDQKGTAADVRRLGELVRAVVADRSGSTLVSRSCSSATGASWEPAP